MLSVKFWTKGDFEGRNYIEQVIKRFSKIKDLSRQKKIMGKSILFCPSFQIFLQF